MYVIKIMQNDKEFLFNGRAYMSANNSEQQLLELEKELEAMGDEYLTMFQFESLYEFYKHFGMPAKIIHKVAQIDIGDVCVVSLPAGEALIKRISKSFCVIDFEK